MFWFDQIIWFKMNLEQKMELIRCFTFLEHSHLGVERPNSFLIRS